MTFVSITRLRIRSFRFMPQFILLTLQTLGQVRRAGGFKGGSLLPDRKLTFWTMTAWTDQAAMRTYITTGSHKVAMPRLLHWCDEASVVHWEQEGDDLPSWPEAAARMRSGRISKVRHPSPEHAGLGFSDPRLGGAAPIKPKRRTMSAPSAARP